MHHELTGNLRSKMEANIQQMLLYTEIRENPYLGTGEKRLHNIITNECVPDLNVQKILKFLMTAQEAFNMYREERFISKTIPISTTMHQQKLPTFSSISQPQSRMQEKKQTVKNAIRNHLLVHRKNDIAKEKGINMAQILTHDISPSSLFDENGATNKPVKSALMSELTKKLGPRDNNFQKDDILKASIIIDSMNQFRRLPLKGKRFEDLFKNLDSNVNNVCKFSRIDYVFDSYLKSSIKSSERERRSSVEPLPLTSISISTKLPMQMKRFWASNSNKVSIQDAFIDYMKTIGINRQWETILSGKVLGTAPTAALAINDGSITKLHDTLAVNVEEADLRIIPHVFHALKQGMQRVIVLSNDTDVFVILIHFYDYLNNNGLSEFWMRKSASDIILIHTLVGKLGATKVVLLAANFITGSDVTSRIGTKLSALKAQPEQYLSKFGQHLPPTTQSFKLAEEYLVKVLEPWSKCNTLDDL